MLEFFFRNYDSWVDKYIIFDDGSTDGSIDILKKHPKVELRRWIRHCPNSYLTSQFKWLNEVWKESRDQADWVVVVDIDEHIFSPQSTMPDLLEQYQSENVTLAPTLGFQLLSEHFPKADEHLVQSCTFGKPFTEMCKISIFNPDQIKEINFTVGRHIAKAVGNVKYPLHDELFLFHYKYLDFERSLAKINSQHANVGEYDRPIIFNYAWTRQELRDFWEDNLDGSSDILSTYIKPYEYPNHYRWWRNYGISFFVFQWFSRFIKFLRNPIKLIKLLIKFTRQGQQIKTNREKYELLMNEINQSPVRKKIYNLVMGKENQQANQDTIVVANGTNDGGILVQCLFSNDIDKLQDHTEIEKLISKKIECEKDHQKKFELCVVTYNIGFTSKAKEFAETNNIKLVSRNDLLNYISQV